MARGGPRGGGNRYASFGEVYECEETTRDERHVCYTWMSGLLGLVISLSGLEIKLVHKLRH
jgi:hypothetical protein